MFIVYVPTSLRNFSNGSEARSPEHPSVGFRSIPSVPRLPDRIPDLPAAVAAAASLSLCPPPPPRQAVAAQASVAAKNNDDDRMNVTTLKR